MTKILKQRILSVIDANYNRAKEGLRVTEDIFRFVKQNRQVMYRIKDIRHGLTGCMASSLLQEAIASRDSARDLGKELDAWERSRSSVEDILWANLQRVKEALRVLEEFCKLIQASRTASFKNIRYKVYELEKAIIEGKYYLRGH